MQKIRNIEFFRFIFALIVCYHHMIISWARIYPQDSVFTKFYHISIGGFCVDLFFIIAGYFLFYSISRCESVLDLMIKKIKRLFPVFAFSLIILSCFKLHFSELILNLMFLQSTSITLDRGINIAAWFISTLVIVSVFYAGVVKSFEKRQGLFIISICTFLAYSFLARKGGTVEFMTTYFLTHGTIRGIAGIGMGYLLADVLIRKGEQIKHFLSSTILMKILTSIFEIVVSVGIIYYVILGKMLLLQRFFIAFAFAGLFVCLILKQGVLSKLLDNNVSVFLGKYAFSIYLMQAVFNTYARKYFWKDYAFISEHFVLAIIFNLLGYTILGIITYHLIENPPQKIKTCIKKLFVKDEVNV